MKKSEILKILSREEGNNVRAFYKLNDISSILIVYVNILSQQSIQLLHERIVDITASEGDEYTIRVSFDRVEFN